MNLDPPKVDSPQNQSPTSASKMLKNHQTLTWLKKRYSTRLPEEYLFNESEKQRYFEIQNIFSKFDSDGTGTLDVKELQSLLKKSDLVFEKD